MHDGDSLFLMNRGALLAFSLLVLEVTAIVLWFKVVFFLVDAVAK